MTRSASILTVLVALSWTGCRTPGERVESRVALAVEFETGPHVETYIAAGAAGEYHFAGHEGEARRVVKSGGGLGVSLPDHSRSPRGVVSPWTAEHILMVPVVADEVLLVIGDEQVLHVTIETGSWQDLSAGDEIELSLTEDSRRQWQAAVRDRFRQILDEARHAVSEQLTGRDERVRAARMFELPADLIPRIRASREQLAFVFDDARMQGEVLVSRWHRSPGPLRPGYDERSRYWGPPRPGEPVDAGRALVLLVRMLLCAFGSNMGAS